MNKLKLITLAMSLVAGSALGQKPIPLSPEMGGRSIDGRALKKGDIILSTTKSFTSKAIRKATRSPVSHAMVYVGLDAKGRHEVIEAITGGVKKRLLREAMKDSSLAVAFRHPKLDDKKRAKMLSHLRRQVGKDYDYWGLVDEAICRYAGKRCSVNLETKSNRWYCSALVLAAYKSAGLPLVRNRPAWKGPGEIAKLRFTDQISYVGHLKTD